MRSPMGQRLLPLLAIALAAALWAPAAAQASFGLEGFDVTYANEDGSPAAQAGSHPFEMTTSFEVPGHTTSQGGFVLDEAAKDVLTEQITGLAPEVAATPRCSSADFLTTAINPEGGFIPDCPDASAVGLIAVTVASETGHPEPNFSAIYNLQPSPGKVLKLGFWSAGVPVQIDASLSESPPYKGLAGSRNISQIIEVVAAKLTIWGVPADPAHDPLRGKCLREHPSGGEPASSGKCPANIPEVPFLTLPRACTGPLLTEYQADSWEHPGSYLPDGEPNLKDLAWDHAEVPLGEDPQGMTGCPKLGFEPSIAAQPTTRAAESATGLDFSLNVADEGLTNPTGIAGTDIRKAVVTLPEGMTANPSSAEGLGVCTEAQLARETAFSAPGEGCPDASKLGTIEVETPLLEERLDGALYLAKPYENEFHSLLALYFVIKDPTLGILVKQAARVEPDPRTGQLITTTEEMPQLPFSHFRLHFREGARSPLVSPPACGEYSAEAKLYPWSGGEPVINTSAFKIITGANESPCPAGGAPPFHPGFEAGSINNAAGSYSPFYMRLTRKDGEQDLTRFSAKLPPGMVAKLAGTSECPAQGIARARSRTGPNGGQEELERPSCPASSKIGHVLAGAGVGQVLTYVPGSLYLAGPYQGAPLSVVAIVPAIAGPFDVGTVVTQVALRIDPLSAEVTADGSSSDPIPHILAGIPLKVRDIRVYVDKPSFTLNPTSCEPSATDATIWGGGANVFSSADDGPVALASRFQAADCASLGFKPALSLRLKGGTKRGKFPQLTGTYTPRPRDANLASLVLRLPHSTFLEQGHFGTICTRVQYAEPPGNGAGCPAGAVYGHATAYTPLLEEPLSGPVYLRSSNHNLPDLVASLHGLVDVEAVARIDSKDGGIRATFSQVPDAPLSKVVVNMQGGKKGLIVNSTDLCAATHRADAAFAAHNGRRTTGHPVVRAQCPKGREHKRKRRRNHHRMRSSSGHPRRAG